MLRVRKCEKAAKPSSSAFEEHWKKESRSVKSNRLLNKRNDRHRLNYPHDAKTHLILCVVTHITCIILKPVYKTYFIIFIPFTDYMWSLREIWTRLNIICGKTKVNIYSIDSLATTELFPVADSGAVKCILTAGEWLPITPWKH